MFKRIDFNPVNPSYIYVSVHRLVIILHVMDKSRRERYLPRLATVCGHTEARKFQFAKIGMVFAARNENVW